MIWVNKIFILSVIVYTIFGSLQLKKHSCTSLCWFFIGCSGLLLNLLVGDVLGINLTLQQCTWVLGPSLYWYILQCEKDITQKIHVHFIPFVICFVLSLLTDYSIINNSFLELFILSPTPRAIHSIIYVLLSAFEVRNYKWKKWTVIATLTLLTIIYVHDFGFFNPIISATLMVFAVLALVVVSAWYVEKHHNRAKTERELTQEKMEDEQERKLLEQVYAKVLKETNDKQLYLNQNLKLSDLNVELGVAEKLISKAINTHAKENFNAFINRFRVKHATNLINSEKYSYYTIDAIAEESGFSNKVSFYKAFKRIEAISPSKYRQNTENGAEQSISSLP